MIIINQSYKQFRGDLELGGLYRIGFEYKDGSHKTTVLLKTDNMENKSVLRDHLLPPIHSEVKACLREVYGDSIEGKNLILVADKDGWFIGRTEHLHKEVVDPTEELTDLSFELENRIKNLALTILKYQMSYQSFVFNAGFTMGDHLERTEKKGEPHTKEYQRNKELKEQLETLKEEIREDIKEHQKTKKEPVEGYQ